MTFPFSPGSGHSLIALTLSGSISTCPGRILYPSQSTYYMSHSHFYSAIIRSASLSFYSTEWTYWMCSSYVSEYMRILSIYRSAYISIYSLNSESTRSWSVAGVFVSPNSMTRYSYRPSYDLNAVIYSSPSLIRVK